MLYEGAGNRPRKDTQVSTSKSRRNEIKSLSTLGWKCLELDGGVGHGPYQKLARSHFDPLNEGSHDQIQNKRLVKMH